MSSQMGFRALLATKPTLKWFVVIGVIIAVIGILLSFVTFGGILIFWVGLILISFSVIALVYLWLTERFLAQPRDERVT